MAEDRAELVQKWKALQEKGVSARDIGLQFGVTKGVVVGALYRLRNPRPPRSKVYSVTALANRRARQKRGENRAKAATPHLELYNNPDFKPVNLINLPANGCLYPVTDLPPHLHCAMPKVYGKPYCKVHLDLCTGGDKIET